MSDLLGQGFGANVAAETMRLAFSLLVASCALFASGNLDWIDGLGGRLEQNAAGDVVAVHLRGTWVTDAELLDLAGLPKLERLDLSHTRITDEGLLHLKPLKQIQDLNLLYAEQITDQGMSAVREWTNLKRLNLRGTRIFDGTLAILSRLTQLESLDIAYTQCTDNGLDALVPLTRLKELSIGRSKLGKNALQVLRLLPTLEYLDLGGPHPGPDGYRTTAGAPMDEGLPHAVSELKQLRVLKLSYSQIRADGLSILASLDQVRKLVLTGCPRVDDSALGELAKWKSLQYLDVQETNVTEHGVDRLEKARPGIVILRGPFPPSHPPA
jgi:Leucine-rich repeat (LRR) protein